MSRKYCAPRRVAYPLRLLDLFVDALVQPEQQKKDAPLVEDPRILMMSSGHLGDTLILTYLFPLIAERYPTAKIDVLAGDWCDPVLVNNPYVRRIIHWNHIGTNRRKINSLQKIAEHIGNMRQAIVSLKEEVYDYSVDIRFSDSPMHQILPFIEVKHSIGFGTRGLGGLLDDELFLPDGEFHHVDLLLSLLARIDVHATLPDIKPYFPLHPNADQTLTTKLPVLTETDRPIVLICPESGAESRFLSIAFWTQLVANVLKTCDAQLIVCGQLPATAKLAAQLQANHPEQGHRLVDSTGRLTIDELATLASKAALAFTVDSFPAHLCAVFCPLITYYNNGMGIQFFPIANFDTLLFHNHLNSRDLALNRPNYQTIFVSEFGETVVNQSIAKMAELLNRVIQ